MVWSLYLARFFTGKWVQVLVSKYKIGRNCYFVHFAHSNLGERGLVVRVFVHLEIGVLGSTVIRRGV